MSEVKHGEGLLVTYTFRFKGKEEREAFEEKADRAFHLLERVVEGLESEDGLEGGRSLVSTFNRFLDQWTYKTEAETRSIDTTIALLKKQAEGQEEERRARAAMLNTIGELNKRLKQLEQQGSSSGGQQRAPFRDARSKPHPQQQRNQKAGSNPNPPVAPTTNEVPQRAKPSEINKSMNNQNEKHKEVAEQKFVNTSLKDELSQFAEHQAGP